MALGPVAEAFQRGLDNSYKIQAAKAAREERERLKEQRKAAEEAVTAMRGAMEGVGGEELDMPEDAPMAITPDYAEQPVEREAPKRRFVDRYMPSETGEQQTAIPMSPVPSERTTRDMAAAPPPTEIDIPSDKPADNLKRRIKKISSKSIEDVRDKIAKLAVYSPELSNEYKTLFSAMIAEGANTHLNGALRALATDDMKGLEKAVERFSAYLPEGSPIILGKDKDGKPVYQDPVSGKEKPVDAAAIRMLRLSMEDPVLTTEFILGRQDKAAEEGREERRLTIEEELRDLAKMKHEWETTTKWDADEKFKKNTLALQKAGIDIARGELSLKTVLGIAEIGKVLAETKALQLQAAEGLPPDTDMSEVTRSVAEGVDQFKEQVFEKVKKTEGTIPNLTERESTELKQEWKDMGVKDEDIFKVLQIASSFAVSNYTRGGPSIVPAIAPILIDIMYSKNPKWSVQLTPGGESITFTGVGSNGQPIVQTYRVTRSMLPDVLPLANSGKGGVLDRNIGDRSGMFPWNPEPASPLAIPEK